MQKTAPPVLTLTEIYTRVLGYLATERRLAITLAAASVVIGIIQLAEPILFGRVVDALSTGSGAFPLIALWAALGLFGIGGECRRCRDCGPAGAPAAVGGDGGCLRAGDHAAAQLPCGAWIGVRRARGDFGD